MSLLAHGRVGRRIHEALQSLYGSMEERGDAFECGVKGQRGLKELFNQVLRSYLTMFNAAATTVHKLNPSIVLMAVVSGVASKTAFKIALERDPPVDLADFYYQADRFLQQEGAEANESVEVNIINDRGLSRTGYGKDKEKRKANDDF